MLELDEIDLRLASALRVPIEVLRGSCGYHDTPGWDSFGHVEVVLMLEELLDAPIDDQDARKLRSREAIHDFCSGRLPTSTGDAASAVSEPQRHERAGVSRGLAGVVFATTSICEIDGEAGRLSYRGMDIEVLADRYRFDDVCALLIDGELPDAAARPAFSAGVAARSALSSVAQCRAAALAGMDPDCAMSALIPILCTEVVTSGLPADVAARETGLSLLARLPGALALALGGRDTRIDTAPSRQPACFVEMALRHLGLTALADDPEAVRYVDTIFLLQAEHSSNASAFAARVAIGACATPGAALSSAMATFSGTLHGGAIRRVVEQMREIKTQDRVQTQLRERRGRGEPIYGFGHRVYRVTDPRARIMERLILEMIDRGYDPEAYNVIRAMCQEMQAFASKGIAPNVDLYAGAIYGMLSIPDDLLLPLFCLARLPGWVAHIREQGANNVLIRPEMTYVPDTGMKASHSGQHAPCK